MPIRSDHRQTSNLSLRDEQTVEWITMMKRQMLKPRGVQFIDAEDRNTVRPQDFDDIAYERDFAERLLDGDLC